MAVKKQKSHGGASRFKTFFRSKTFFTILALFMLVFVSIFSVRGISFLVRNLNRALSTESPGNGAVKFDIKTFQELRLVR